MVIKKFLEKSKDYNLIRKSDYFDSKWYKKTYNVSGDAAWHYLRHGAKLGYNPGPNFSRIKYELIYEDVRCIKANPLVHYEKYGCYEKTFTEEIYICDKEKEKIDVIKKQQDKLINKEYNLNLENLIVFLVPEIDMIGGGVMSINSIAKVTKELKNIHNSEVIICTMPNPKTFNKYSKFNADFNIYRFEQLKRFKKLKNLIIHIPELYVHPFLYFITPEQQLWLKNIENVHINVLNQNVDFLPRPRHVDYLKELSNKVTMTCAHKKYCVPQMRTSYDIDVHLLSTSNFTKYEYVPYSKKENLLVYSIDEHPMKERIIEKIEKEFPDLETKEIRNMSYTEYLDTISKAKWMITFGEGLDGYFLESLRSGTMAFSTYNLNFFDDSYDGMPNIFEDYSDMFDNIVSFMKKNDSPRPYKKIVDACIEIDKKMYDDDEYVDNIKQFYLGNYTLPISEVFAERAKRIERKPLVSVALASYNGEKYIGEQIESIINQDYPNIEIIVSDDGSSDETLKILKQYENKIRVVKNTKKHGLVGNFSNALKHCKGEYIALSDQDDIWEPNKISKLLGRIDEFDIVQSGVCIIDEKGNYHPSDSMHIHYEIDKTTKYRMQDNIFETTILGCTTLMRANFVKQYAAIPDEIIYHDVWLLYNAIMHGNGVAYIDEQLVRYRQHGENTAFLIYNSNSWKDKKIRADKYMIEIFPKMDNKLKRLFILDINYNILMDAFRKSFPNELRWFLKENFYNMDNRSMSEAINQINSDIKKYKVSKF